MSSLEEFKQSEANLKKFHQKYNQAHLKFEFPDNKKPNPGLQKYFDDNGYDTGFWNCMPSNQKTSLLRRKIRISALLR
ncbi:DUF5613 domain-containing protein [Lentibacillus salinarum]|uniref:DUF5613 domain-containing protein n=1 Tax=Lentibacillus salinarum TaxID=446820 RepID=A0ABW3ZRK4_9BACI